MTTWTSAISTNVSTTPVFSLTGSSMLTTTSQILTVNPNSPVTIFNSNGKMVYQGTGLPKQTNYPSRNKASFFSSLGIKIEDYEGYRNARTEGRDALIRKFAADLVDDICEHTAKNDNQRSFFFDRPNDEIGVYDPAKLSPNITPRQANAIALSYCTPEEIANHKHMNPEDYPKNESILLEIRDPDSSDAEGRLLYVATDWSSGHDIIAQNGLTAKTVTLEDMFRDNVMHLDDTIEGKMRLSNGDELRVKAGKLFFKHANKISKYRFAHPDEKTSVGQMLRSSEILESFVKWLKEHKISSSQLKHINMKDYMQWIILETARIEDEVDENWNFESKELIKRIKATIPGNRCLHCGSFLHNDKIEKDLKFCNGEHYDKYLNNQKSVVDVTV